jgi:hypothetical protein
MAFPKIFKKVKKEPDLKRLREVKSDIQTELYRSSFRR